MKLVTAQNLKRREADEAERTIQYGPVPINPFKRLREQAGLTLGDVAAYSRVDRRALQRCEHGMYTNPLPTLVSYWVHTKKATEGELLNAYADYQLEQRLRHHKWFGPELAADPLGSAHPFRQLRATRPSLIPPYGPLPVGLTEVCQALCLPLDSIQFFEKKFRLQKSVPRTLINALNQIGYTRSQISNFEACYDQWRKRNKSIQFS